MKKKLIRSPIDKLHLKYFQNLLIIENADKKTYICSGCWRGKSLLSCCVETDLQCQPLASAPLPYTQPRNSINSKKLNCTVCVCVCGGSSWGLENTHSLCVIDGCWVLKLHDFLPCDMIEDAHLRVSTLISLVVKKFPVAHKNSVWMKHVHHNISDSSTHSSRVTLSTILLLLFIDM